MKPNDLKTYRVIAVGTKDIEDDQLVCSLPKGDVPAKWQSISHNDNCKWRMYYIDCQFATAPMYFNLKYKYAPSTMPTTQLYIRELVIEKLPVTVCFNHMFMFEKWQNALAAFELYIAYGASALVVPVHSVVEDFYEILLYFQRRLKGLRLNKSVLLPKIKDLGFDTNSEVEKASWLLSASECLFFYRQASEFIIFADYDEVIVPRYSNHLYEELWSLSQQNPTAASFEFRIATTAAYQHQSPQKYSVKRMVLSALVQEVAEFGVPAVVANRTGRPFLHSPLAKIDIGDYDHKLMSKEHAWAYKFNYPFFNPVLKDVAIPSYLDPDSDIVNNMEKNFHIKIKENNDVYQKYLKLRNERIYERKMAGCIKKRQGTPGQCENSIPCLPPPSKILPRCVVIDSRATQYADPSGRNFYVAVRRVLQRQDNCRIKFRDAEPAT
ncbi:unnamed protein product [Bursaphelenchus okinawaensis]|uniref:Glycosyltransferase family 92 protein n=1 Tax=Bursaphelenchus okinawaensis TaxID=465554 RepID=A0A811KV10_9BILA|nr:unnamed protein product [Bursaphelenchus okinawaensis]CAG9113753.1 unnamed protein product [Bursaphelenchus okinawaensis]